MRRRLLGSKWLLLAENICNSKSVTNTMLIKTFPRVRADQCLELTEDFKHKH